MQSQQIQSSSQVFLKDPKSFAMMCRDIGDDDTSFVYKEEQQHEHEEDDSVETWLIPTGFLPFSDDVDASSTPDVVFDLCHPFPSPPHQIHHARKTARTTFTSSSSYYPLTHSESFHLLHNHHHHPSSVDTYDPFMHKPISPAVQSPSPLAPTPVPPNMRPTFSSGSPPKSTPTTHQISRSDARSSHPTPPQAETRNAATTAATQNSREAHLSPPRSRKRQDSTPTPPLTTTQPPSTSLEEEYTHTSDSDGLATPTASRIFEMFEQSVASMEEPFPRKNKKANKNRTTSLMPNLHDKNEEEEEESEESASLEQSYLSSQHHPAQMAGLPPSSEAPGPTQQDKFVWHSYGGPRGRGEGANQNHKTKSKRAPSRSLEVHPDKKKKRQPKGY